MGACNTSLQAEVLRHAPTQHCRCHDTKTLPSLNSDSVHYLFFFVTLHCTLTGSSEVTHRLPYSSKGVTVHRNNAWRQRY
ncbi:hypothetical protein E2C01_049366 [Portunus trituberculatus]|uniref:Uncharacterized protein n=1 Tax=Portunus trituberculatus TaxID=210409 RepID=A0A5B7G675_PORTR|nr:hypothetical protein [Portunus trituberculatus]